MDFRNTVLAHKVIELKIFGAKVSFPGLTPTLDRLIAVAVLLVMKPFCKRAADYAFLVPFAREMVCPLTGELRGTHVDSYHSNWS